MSETSSIISVPTTLGLNDSEVLVSKISLISSMEYGLNSIGSLPKVLNSELSILS